MNVWVEAARPKTLPAAVGPVLVGTAAAQAFVAWRFAAALIVSLALQVAVNYANDYSDAVRGVDTGQRAGPRRAVAAGLVSPARMRVATIAALVVAAIAGLLLAAAVGWELLVVGLGCMLAALAYSGGPKPYASAGLGELFVFVFFGLVATVGSAYVQAERVLALAVVAAIPVGLLISAILVVNNLRDIPTDRAAGKLTLAVRLGQRHARSLCVGLVAAAFALVSTVALVAGSLWPFLAWAALPLAVAPMRTVASVHVIGRALTPALAQTARLQLACSALLAAGLLLG